MEGPICEWMRRQYNISIRLDWTRACIQWLQNEGGMNHHAVDVTSSRENVYQQWLHSDIRQSCTGCLPSHVTSAPSGTINGQYILQVDSVVDVGSSAYSQLMKLKGREVDEPSNQSKNYMESNKPTRMLLLKLTDGVIDINGMEYRYITQLSTSIPPGTKVVLRGPIHYRLGTLLLTGDHVMVLGGNVDQYVVENDQQRVLARELNREDLIEEGQSELENHHSNQDPPINTQPSQEEIILLPINRILSQPDIWSHHPIVYVKATFRRFNGDLRFIEGVWSMNATIADGTGEIPVLLGNAPLEVIIGCSARDFERINRGEGERRLKRCREILMSLHCVMELKYDNIMSPLPTPLPVVTRLLDV